jgi:HSP20 family protein
MINFQGVSPKTVVDLGVARPTIALKPSAWRPIADVYESKDHLVIEIELAGCKGDTVTAKVVQDQIPGLVQLDAVFYVVVEGQRAIVPNVSRRFHNERWQGDFARLFRIPAGYDADKAESAYDDGLLRVTIPKKPAQFPQISTILSQKAKAIKQKP